jgi:hypothetical protein
MMSEFVGVLGRGFNARAMGAFVPTCVSRPLITMVLAATLSGCFDSGADTVETSAAATPSGQPVQTTPVNRPPEIAGVPDAAAQVGDAFSFRPTASDADGDLLGFSITNQPAWAQFNDDDGTLSGTPGTADVGQTADITITVTDGRDTRSVGPFNIEITARPATPTPAPTNTAPTISGTATTSVDVNAAYRFQPFASDNDGNTLRFSISNRPSWTLFDPATGTLSGTPLTANIATYSNIVISVSDGKVRVSLPAFAIQVKGPSNRAPTIAGAPAKTVQVAQSYSFAPAGSDPDGDALTYSIVNKPSWASFSTSTGRLSGTPAEDKVGTYGNVTIRVSDGKLSASLAAFTIAVQSGPNKEPTISGTPVKTGKVGTTYSFQPTATDPDGDDLGYSIRNCPTWASFSTATGKLAGSPTSAGTFGDIVISVSDGKVTKSLAAFAITVGASDNRAPVIAGKPATSVSADADYNFQPAGSDADGDALTYSIENKPSWASFNKDTGALSGAPGTANIGSFANIVIRVSDGQVSTALAPFNITVTQVQVGSATLTWQAPTQNTDGTSLADLAGYFIVYGKSASALTQTVDLKNPSLTTYVVESLTSGTWYFAVKAYTSKGAESDKSNIATKTIP